MEQTENKEEFLGKEQMSEFMKGIFELKQEEIKDYEQEMMSLDTQFEMKKDGSFIYGRLEKSNGKKID
ncbi:13164_t:CDS:2 [Rhizophagus irregularis]|nr:13164_t:CDS:2 [Rhizophagus irregularis]